MNVSFHSLSYPAMVRGNECTSEGIMYTSQEHQMLGTGYLPHRAISRINYIPKHSENQISLLVELISVLAIIAIWPLIRTSMYKRESVN